MTSPQHSHSSDLAKIREEAAKGRRSQRLKRFNKLTKHPLFIALIAFLGTGIIANNYQSRLTDAAKEREVLLAKRQRTADAVKIVTDLIFERVFRGSMVISSIVRKASPTELLDRKKSYDDIFVKYNATIQSNLFRLREMFNTTQYTAFESAMEGGLRDLLAAQDSCVTIAYDDAVSTDEQRKSKLDDILEHCHPMVGQKRPMDFGSNGIAVADIYHHLIHCEYTFTNALFQAVEGQDVRAFDASKVPSEVNEACSLSSTAGQE